MRRLAVVGGGTRAGGVAAAIEAGAGMVLAEGDAAEAVVAAGNAAAESLALAREALEAGKPTLCLDLPGDLATLEAQGLVLRVDRPITVQGRLGRDIDTNLGKGGAPLRVTTSNGSLTVK